MTFKKAPFGMLTSGNAFQRAIDLILEKDCNGRVLHNIASSYSDDGAVYSITNGHIDDLTRVLKLLKKCGAVLGLNKCISQQTHIGGYGAPIKKVTEQTKTGLEERSMEISPWGLVVFSCLTCDVTEVS